jgi:DNA helicase II / ATP-dependent DNA helicase PcrA
MFDLKNIQVSNDDIVRVEDFLKIKFNEDQKKVIRYWSSADIQACPGSGKTTTLAAKLIILARKIPQDFQHGVCVITHTNTAVKEIKQKLGVYARFYNRYPNHFGTIQSFVDKYLTIPAYKNEYKRTPRIVDDSTYTNEIRKVPTLKYSGTQTFLDMKSIEAGYLSFNKHNFLVSRNINTPDPIPSPGISAEKWKVHYDRIVSVKRTLLEEGYIKYDEAYSIAFKYLRENARLRKTFALRFPIVFIDEMQDMELHQCEIIDTLFGKEAAIIQRIGDVNQAIFSRVDSESAVEWKPVINPELKLSISNRVAHNLAEIAKDICISPIEMKGWKNESPIKPALIVYPNSKIGLVKDKFGELIIQNNLIGTGQFKCIGARVGTAARLNLQSYWSDFNRVTNKSEMQTLYAYLEAAKKSLAISRNLKDCKRLFFEMFCKALKLNRVKNVQTGLYFTPYSLTEFLIQTNRGHKLQEINREIFDWINKMKKGTGTHQEVANLTTSIIELFTTTKYPVLSIFLENVGEAGENVKPENKKYRYVQNDKEVEIEFDTIHGVKGETHAATLYVECYLRIFDIGGKIIKFIAGDEKQRSKLRKDSACSKQLPLAYVALTRASHFFAIAIDKERFTEAERNYFEIHGDVWQVHYL